MTQKQTLALIGVGAFGEFAIPHLLPHFDMIVYDAYRDVSGVYSDIVHVADTVEQAIAQADIICLAVPVCALEQTIQKIAPCVKAGQLVMDIASVKVKPVQWMQKYLPDTVDIVATHPIFGPQSGKNGIEGLKITLLNVRGNRLDAVNEFCADVLGLQTIITTAENHDKDMAYVQGLTHLIAKILGRMDIPHLQQTTKTYDHLLDMVNMIKNDSDELFYAIQNDNPYVRDVTNQFFKISEGLEKSLHLISDR